MLQSRHCGSGMADDEAVNTLREVQQVDATRKFASVLPVPFDSGRRTQHNVKVMQNCVTSS
jgi:hypothetical protein